jgi:hypothetical protein
MMEFMACCPHTGAQYLNTDGTINEQALMDLDWAIATVTPDKPRHKDKEKYVGFAAELVKQVKNGRLGKMCTCCCHIIGEKVLH